MAGGYSWNSLLVGQNCTFLGPRYSNDSNRNQTLYKSECAQQLLYELYHVYKVFFPLKSWEAMLFSAAYILLVILGVFGNGLVVIAVLRKKEMRTNRNVFIANLAVSNLILALILYPFLWTPQKEFLFTYGAFLCKFCNAFPGSNLYCSTLTISIMAIDRYYLVKSTRIGDSRSRKMTAVVLSAGVWFFSLALCLPIFMSYDVNSVPPEWVDLPIGNGQFETFGYPICVYKSPVMIGFAIIFINFFFLYIVPLVVLGVFNLKLTHFIQNQARGSLLQPPSIAVTRDRCGSSIVNRRSSPSNNAVTVSEQRRSRTTHLMIAMAGSYAVLWLPFTIISLLTDLEVMQQSPRLDYTAKLISLLSICVNPFLYGWLNTNFNREFREIFAQLPCYKWYLKHHPELKDQRTNAVELTYCNNDTVQTRGSAKGSFVTFVSI